MRVSSRLGKEMINGREIEHLNEVLREISGEIAIFVFVDLLSGN